MFAALYNGARPQGLGFLHYNAEPMTAETARNQHDIFGYFDYVNGRVMKVDLSGDELNPSLYDRDNGAGAAARIINGLKTTGDVNPEEAELAHLEGRRNAAMLMKEHVHDESHVGEKGRMAIVHLGVKEFADELEPKLDEVLYDEDDES